MALFKRMAWCIKALPKESPEVDGEMVSPLGECPGVSISAATTRRGGKESSIASGGCLLTSDTLRRNMRFWEDIPVEQNPEEFTWSSQ
jgi:hypothetical protein